MQGKLKENIGRRERYLNHRIRTKGVSKILKNKVKKQVDQMPNQMRCENYLEKWGFRAN